MNKFIYLTLSFFLCFTMLSTLMEFTITASNPIFFNGGTVGVMKWYKNTTHPELLYLSDYPHGCNGMWNCAKVMQDLYIKYNQRSLITININPIPNITQKIENYPAYYVTCYFILFSIISVILSLFGAFIISLRYFLINRQTLLNINLNDDNRWTNTQKLAYSALFILRIPVYVSIILIYTYLSPHLVIDTMPSNLVINRYISVFTLLSAYIVDNFVFPYQMIKN